MQTGQVHEPICCQHNLMQALADHSMQAYLRDPQLLGLIGLDESHLGHPATLQEHVLAGADVFLALMLVLP